MTPTHDAYESQANQRCPPMPPASAATDCRRHGARTDLEDATCGIVCRSAARDRCHPRVEASSRVTPRSVPFSVAPTRRARPVPNMAPGHGVVKPRRLVRQRAMVWSKAELARYDALSKRPRVTAAPRPLRRTKRVPPPSPEMTPSLSPELSPRALLLLPPPSLRRCKMTEARRLPAASGPPSPFDIPADQMLMDADGHAEDDMRCDWGLCVATCATRAGKGEAIRGAPPTTSIASGMINLKL